MHRKACTHTNRGHTHTYTHRRSCTGDTAAHVSELTPGLSRLHGLIVRGRVHIGEHNCWRIVETADLFHPRRSHAGHGTQLQLQWYPYGRLILHCLGEMQQIHTHPIKQCNGTALHTHINAVGRGSRHTDTISKPLITSERIKTICWIL